MPIVSALKQVYQSNTESSLVIDIFPEIVLRIGCVENKKAN